MLTVSRNEHNLRAQLLNWNARKILHIWAWQFNIPFFQATAFCWFYSKSIFEIQEIYKCIQNIFWFGRVYMCSIGNQFMLTNLTKHKFTFDVHLNTYSLFGILLIFPYYKKLKCQKLILTNINEHLAMTVRVLSQSLQATIAIIYKWCMTFVTESINICCDLFFFKFFAKCDSSLWVCV